MENILIVYYLYAFYSVQVYFWYLRSENKYRFDSSVLIAPPMGTYTIICFC